MTPLQILNAVLTTIGRAGNPRDVAAWHRACVACCGLSTAMRQPLLDSGDVAYTTSFVREQLQALEAEAKALPFDDLARVVCYLADLGESIDGALPAAGVVKAQAVARKARAA